jgi:hypothetical protein
VFTGNKLEFGIKAQDADEMMTMDSTHQVSCYEYTLTLCFGTLSFPIFVPREIYYFEHSKQHSIGFAFSIDGVTMTVRQHNSSRHYAEPVIGKLCKATFS